MVVHGRFNFDETQTSRRPAPSSNGALAQPLAAAVTSYSEVVGKSGSIT